MPQTKKKRRDREEHDDEPELDEEEATVARDFVMARVGAAIASLDASKAALIEMLGYFVSPDEDPKNKKRSELADVAIEHAACATRALDTIEEELDEYDPEQAEPWDDEADDDGEDD